MVVNIQVQQLIVLLSNYSAKSVLKHPVAREDKKAKLIG